MGKKPKAGGAPRKPKEPKLEDKAQSERFVATAREIGADESGKYFDQVIAKLLKPPTNAAG